jgi:WD repeat-containing protein 7
VLTCEKLSDPPLDGFLADLHVTQNGRTKERFILGGADDGSIAFWDFEYA